VNVTPEKKKKKTNKSHGPVKRTIGQVSLDLKENNWTGKFRFKTSKMLLLVGQ
jgi:hypothetical protein